MAIVTVTDSDRPGSRPFRLGDAMIFIIALGLGLALARPAIALIADAIGTEPRWRFQTIAGAVSLGRMCNIVVLNFLFFLLPAFLIVRLRRPRPALRSLISQPGFVACATPVAIVFAGIPLSLLGPDSAGQVIELVGQTLAIAAAPLLWIILIATGRWNAEPGWIDRLGRVLGVLWMVVVPLHFVLIKVPY